MQIQRIQVLKSLHWMAKTLLEKAGYEWKLIKKGDHALGYWRINFDKKNQNKNGKIKRFVLVPGFGDTPMSWLPVLIMLGPSLRKSYDEVVLMDFPGFKGFLSEEECFPTMDKLMSATAEALDKLKPHTVLGHSMGGWLSAFYAAEFGKARVRSKSYAGPEKLILACPAGIFGAPVEKEAWRNNMARAIGADENPIEGKLFAKAPMWFRLIEDEFMGFIARKDIRDFMLSIGDRHTLEDRAGLIRSKVWIVWGELDKLIPSKCVYDWLSSLQTERKAVYILDAGHGPHVEKPAVTAVVLGQILSDSEPYRIGKHWWKLIDQKPVSE